MAGCACGKGWSPSLMDVGQDPCAPGKAPSREKCLGCISGSCGSYIEPIKLILGGVVGNSVAHVLHYVAPSTFPSTLSSARPCDTTSVWQKAPSVMFPHMCSHTYTNDGHWAASGKWSPCTGGVAHTISQAGTKDSQRYATVNMAPFAIFTIWAFCTCQQKVRRTKDAWRRGAGATWYTARVHPSAS